MATTKPIRIPVGGNVQPAKLIARVAPIYPDELKAQGITGMVEIQAILTKQGYLTEVRVVNTVDPGLPSPACLK